MEKIQSILYWPIPKNITEVNIFHGLKKNYKRFIRNFNGIRAPLIDCTRGKTFNWTKAAIVSFEQLKKRVIEAHILTLPEFDKLFTLECDASGVSIGAVVS